MFLEMSSYDQAFFNGLPSIEAADSVLREENLLELAFSKLAHIFIKFGVTEDWGICLLHNHWRLEDGEIPLQSVSDCDGRKEYITVPGNLSTQHGCWPSVIALRSLAKDGFHPLEYSSDYKVQVANRILNGKQPFLEAVARALEEAHLQNLFGLFALREVSHPNYELIEYNSRERVSIVREVVAAELDGKKFIQTVWRFHPNLAKLDCEGSCFQRCAIPQGSDQHVDEGHTPVHRPDGD
jgi:hypothetical protein